MPQDSKFIPLDAPDPQPGASQVNAQAASSRSKFIPLDPRDVLPKGTKPVKLTPTQEAEFQRRVDEGHPIRDTLPFTLGTLGMLAGPEGSAVGAATGRLMQHTMDKGKPLTPGEAGLDALTAGGSTYLGGKLLGPIESKLGSALAATFFQKGIRKLQGEPNQPFGEEVTDLGKDLGINLGLNIIGGHVINRVTGANKPSGEPFGQVANQTRQNIITPGPTTETGTLPSSTPQYGASAQGAIRGNLARAKAVEKQAFDEFRDTHIAGNTETLNKLVGMEQSSIIDPNTGKAPLIPKIEQVQIRGPIYTANTQALAQEVIPKLDQFMKGETFQKLPPVSQAKYAKLYGTIQDLATPFESVDTKGNPVSVPVKEFETVKDVRTDINKAISGKPTPSFPEAGLKKLADTLGQDIDTSIGSFWKNGADAQTSLDKANAATRFKKQVFNKEIQSRLYGKYESGSTDVRTPADSSEVFKQAYQSPEKAQRLMTAMGPENTGYIKGDYFDNVLMKKAFGPDLSKFNPDAIVTDLENPNSVSRVIFNADERNNVLRFARAARSMAEDSTGGSLSFNKGRFVMNLGMGASKLLTGSSTPARVIIGAKQLMENLQSSKISTDLASRLIKIRPDSMEAQRNAQMLLRGFRGVELNVDLGDGQEKKATVNEGGKLVF